MRTLVDVGLLLVELLRQLLVRVGLDRQGLADRKDLRMSSGARSACIRRRGEEVEGAP